MKCSFVEGLSSRITRFCFSLCLTDKSILSKESSSISSASSMHQVVTPCNDLRFAVWSPLDVLIPLNMILLPFSRFTISSLVILNLCCLLSSSIFSLNSGMIETFAERRVYLVNRIVCPGSVSIRPKRKTPVKNDLPDPRPPVRIVYRVSFQKRLYFVE